MAVRRYFLLSGVVCLLVISTLNAARVTDGLVVGYDFREGSGTTVIDHSGFETPLNLTIHEPDFVEWHENGSLSITDATIISSASDINIPPEGTAEKIFEAVTDAEEITMEAWIVPGNDFENDGPARVMTMSFNPTNRNFTMGQDQLEYEMRVRTTTAGNNGHPLRVRTDDSSVETELQHVVYTRNEDGETALYIDGEIAPVGFGNEGEDPVDGDLSNWDDTYDFALGNELTWTDINQRDWLGTYHLIAVYNRALTEEEVGANFAAGESALIRDAGLPGDFDGNGMLDVLDVNALNDQISNGVADATFDLNSDGAVDESDLQIWVKDLKNTWIGDADLDGEFRTTDLVSVFQTGKFEKDVSAGWEDGDWNGDGRFGTADFITAFQDGGFEKGPRVAVKSVPEPGTFLMVSFSLLCICKMRIRNRHRWQP